MKKPFYNSIIKALNAEKPHIVKIDGLWRVCPLSKKARLKSFSLWAEAHDFVNILNQPLLEKIFSKENEKCNLNN